MQDRQFIFPIHGVAHGRLANMGRHWKCDVVVALQEKIGILIGRTVNVAGLIKKPMLEDKGRLY